ncbi:MAG: V-type ATPase subunit [Verrucomicrobiota bacterium]|nr:V-type ATPase subunit [Verrucomicrobiota bacterium]
MARVRTNDLDYLTARLHARRSRMAEGARLDPLCRIPSVPEFCHALFPGAEMPVADAQRRLVLDLIRELSACLAHVDAEGNALVGWMLVRFQVENAKVLLRGFLNHSPWEALQPHLVSLPPELELDAPALARVESIEEFIGHLPAGAPRSRLGQAASRQRNDLRPFFLEAALDSGYLHELLARAERIGGEKGQVIQALVFQEAGMFQLMLGVRGRFHYGLPADALQSLSVIGAGRSDQWFRALLAAPDVLAAARCALGHALDELPPERKTGGPATANPASVETLAWNRLLRLANHAFRRSHVGLGAVAGYVGLRRVEVANLITISEGIRAGLDAEKLRARLIPRTALEGPDV